MAPRAVRARRALSLWSRKSVGGFRPNQTSYGVFPLGRAGIAVVLITHAIKGSNCIYDWIPVSARTARSRFLKIRLATSIEP